MPRDCIHDDGRRKQRERAHSPSMAPASFSDDSSWDSAVVSAGTLRPVSSRIRSISALNVRDYDKRKRPSSKMSESSCCNSGLNQFRRSLRLLGVPSPPRPPDPAPVRPHVKAARPKVFTRVERRTVSTEDVRSAILDDSRPQSETASRGLVSRAVYEEWYFRKQQEAKRIREARIQEEKEKRWKEENVKLEKEKKSRQKFEEWLKNKEETKKTVKTENKTGSKRFALNRTHGDKEAIEAAYLKWKEEKEKEAAKKKEMEKKEAEEEKERKRIEAQKAFESWKKKAEEELKKQAAKETAEERLKAEDQEKLKEERQKEAESSFRAWREAKDREMKNRLARLRKKEARKREEEEQRQNERKYEAEQAFRSWLDGVLEKEQSREKEVLSDGSNMNLRLYSITKRIDEIFI